MNLYTKRERTLCRQYVVLWLDAQGVLATPLRKAGIEGHPFHELLLSDENFKRAWTLVRKRWVDPTRTEESWEPLSFFQAVAQPLEIYLEQCSRKGKPLLADARTKKQGIAACARLVQLMEEGVKFGTAHHFKKNALFRHLLMQLSAEMRKEKRKPYIGADWRERQFIFNIAEFLGAMGFQSMTVLADLAAMVDYRPDRTTLQRIMRQAARMRVSPSLVEQMETDRNNPLFRLYPPAR